MTRAEAQAEIDRLYADGKIDREEWSHRFDELSSNRWGAQGPKATKQPDENNQ